MLPTTELSIYSGYGGDGHAKMYGGYTNTPKPCNDETFAS
jgi:hypothetical protein